MKAIQDLIEQYGRFATVMLVGRNGDIPHETVALLTDSGINVLGPVDTASKALTIVGQTRTDLALVAPQLAGDRTGNDLARHLSETWGVPSVMLQAG